MRGFVIGLTGGTGTGKSALAGHLRRLGAAFYSVDAAAHALYRRDRGVVARTLSAFGPGVLCHGGIDRERLGVAAFASARALAMLDRAVHPALGREARAAVARMRHRHPVVAVEAGAILFTLGLHAMADAVVVTRCARRTRLCRLAGARGLGVAGASRRLSLLRAVESRMLVAARRCRHARFLDTDVAPAGLNVAALEIMAEARAETAA